MTSVTPLPPKKEKKRGRLISVFKKTKGFDRTTTTIPPIVAEPILWLKERNALGEEGIFRIPGSATEIKEIKARYDKGKKVDLNQVTNIHTVAGVLKVFFRELPEPILTFELYDAWLEAMKPEDLRTKLRYIKTVLKTLPTGNRIILDTLLSFLKEVSLHTTNCMNIKNLAIVFAPNLIRPRVEKIEDILANSSTINTLMVLLVEYYNFLFLDKELEESINQADQLPVMQPIKLPIQQPIPHKDDPKSSEPESPRNKDSKNRGVVKKTRHEVKKSKEDDGRPKRPKMKKKREGSDEFMKKLKFGTMRLATSLLEEQELACELQDIDKLSPSEVEALEQKLESKFKESKYQKHNARTVRKIQRIQSSNFSKLREIGESSKEKRLSIVITRSSSVKDMVKQPTESNDTPNQPEDKVSEPNDEIETETVDITEELNKLSIENTDVNEELNEEYYKFEDELDDILSEDDDLEKESSIEDSTASTNEQDEEEDEEEEEIIVRKSNVGITKQPKQVDNVIEAVLSGNMTFFEGYLTDLKKMKRMERSKSKKQMMAKINGAKKVDDDDL